MQYKFTIKIDLGVNNCSLKEITAIFIKSLRPVFEKVVKEILITHAEEYMKNGTIQRMLKVKKVVWRSRQGKYTVLKTMFGKIYVPQMRVKYKDELGKIHQKCITRLLLGISPYQRIPDFMKKIIGLMGSLSTYRVCHQVLNVLTACKYSLMSLHRGVKWFANKIELGLSKDGTNEFLSDGTGIPTKDSGKRGSELKALMQIKKNGKLHLCGLEIGKYKEGWEKVFHCFKDGIKRFEKIILTSDGDNSMIKAAKAFGEKVKIQRDLWHIRHQLKWFLWKDKVQKDYRPLILEAVGKLTTNISETNPEERKKELDEIVYTCRAFGYEYTAEYLSNCREHMFTYYEEFNETVDSSLIERMMRTINQRINVGVWSDEGALAATKIRLAYYYNGLSVSI